MKKITIPKIIDAHVHLREGDILSRFAEHAIEDFVEAILPMPNLTKPVDSPIRELNYANQIRHATRQRFQIIPCIKLTNRTNPNIIKVAREIGIRVLKFYPVGTTTNAKEGYRCVQEIDRKILLAAEKYGMIFSQHPQKPGFDPFDAERFYFQDDAPWLVENFPNLKMVFEHITTKEAAEFILNANDNVGATVTAHHQVLTKQDVYELDGSIKNPWLHCSPPMNSLEDQLAVREAVFQCSRIFSGSDSALHTAQHKDISAPNMIKPGIWVPIKVAMALWLEIFYQAGKLDQFVDFTSMRPTSFYGLNHSNKKVTFERKPWTVPENIDGIVPLMAGQEVFWQVASK